MAKYKRSHPWQLSQVYRICSTGHWLWCCSTSRYLWYHHEVFGKTLNCGRQTRVEANWRRKVANITCTCIKDLSVTAYIELDHHFDDQQNEQGNNNKKHASTTVWNLCKTGYYSLLKLWRKVQPILGLGREVSDDNGELRKSMGRRLCLLMAKYRWLQIDAFQQICIQHPKMHGDQS